MSELTRILSAIGQGDPRGAEQLLPLVYDDLRRLAAARLAEERPGQTLQATALVHEAYLRLVGNQPPDSDGHPARVKWNSRGHFFCAAAEAMRRILVDRARRKLSEKGGGAYHRRELVDVAVPERLSPLELLALDEALQRLESESSQHAALVKLRYFSGLTLEDAAASLGISLTTAKRQWAFVRAWLFGQLADEGNDSQESSRSLPIP